MLQDDTDVSYSVSYDIPIFGPDPTLLLAVRKAEQFGELLKGFFEIPLPTRSGTVELRVRTNVSTPVVVEFMTRLGGEVSAVRSRGLRRQLLDPGCGLPPLPPCPDLLCDGGAQICTVDADCLDATCPDGHGCSGGELADRACDFNSECDSGICRP